MCKSSEANGLRGRRGQGKGGRLSGTGQCGYSLGVTGQIEERGFYLDYKGFLSCTEI